MQDNGKEMIKRRRGGNKEIERERMERRESRMRWGKYWVRHEEIEKEMEERNRKWHGRERNEEEVKEGKSLISSLSVKSVFTEGSCRPHSFSCRLRLWLCVCAYNKLIMQQHAALWLHTVNNGTHTAGHTPQWSKAGEPTSNTTHTHTHTVEVKHPPRICCRGNGIPSCRWTYRRFRLSATLLAYCWSAWNYTQTHTASDWSYCNISRGFWLSPEGWRPIVLQVIGTMWAAAGRHSPYVYMTN